MKIMYEDDEFGSEEEDFKRRTSEEEDDPQRDVDRENARGIYPIELFNNKNIDEQ